jgi:hypothetical protein
VNDVKKQFSGRLKICQRTVVKVKLPELISSRNEVQDNLNLAYDSMRIEKTKKGGSGIPICNHILRSGQIIIMKWDN